MHSVRAEQPGPHWVPHVTASWESTGSVPGQGAAGGPAAPAAVSGLREGQLRSWNPPITELLVVLGCP